MLLGLARPTVSKGQALLIGYGLFVLVCNSVPVSANTISEGFMGDDFPRGTVVSVKKNLPGDIELTNLNNSEYLIGVVNNKESSAVIFRNDEDNVSVALSGEVEVFVTDVNGEINRGDFVGASWLAGVGMKANTLERQKLVGIAQDGVANWQDYGGIETDSGEKNARIGTVVVRLFDKENIQPESTGSGVEQAVENIVGQDVSLVRIIIGSLLFAVSLAVASMFIFSSIRGSFISIGRNPLASSSIHKGMTRVAVLAVIIILAGATSAYVVWVF